MLKAIAKKIILKYWMLPLIPAILWIIKGYMANEPVNLMLFFLQIIVSTCALLVLMIPVEYFKSKRGCD